MAAPSFLNCLYFPREMSRIFAEEVLFAGDDTRNLREWQRVYRYYLGKLSLRYPGKQLLLKNPANSARVRHLRAMFPGAKFIHVHREPLDVFRSTCTFYHRMLTAVALQDHDEAHVRTHIAWAYERLMHILLSDLASLPAQDLIDMPYARLVAEPLQSVEHVYAGLGLELGPDVRADIDRFVRDTTVTPAPAPRMTADVTDDLCARWKPIFDALGYRCGASGADP
jgi:hypothetical protein